MSNITWTDNKCPRSKIFGDIYYNVENGIAESKYVYLEQNNLAEKFLDTKIFRIAELGFGTGLNFLNVKNLWQELSMKDGVLEFFSVEKFPLTSDELAKALSPWQNELKPERIVEWTANLKDNFNILEFKEERIILHLFIGDVKDFLPSLPTEINAWFLDGFAPSLNPEMWCEELFFAMGKKSSKDASFATFTAAGRVSRALQANGFKVEKVKGYGRKREMLRGSI